jgi:hypothetical protein
MRRPSPSPSRRSHTLGSSASKGEWTSEVDVVLEEAIASGRVLVGTGACVEQYGSGQAYLPVLGAIAVLCRGRGTEREMDVSARHVRTWLLQFPGVVRPDRLDDLQRRAAGATQARTLCELADALEALTFVRSFCCL